jgi:hypothetical protein
MPLFIFILIVVIIAYIWSSIRRKKYMRNIKKAPQFTTATITRYKGLRYRLKNNIWFYYHYTVNEKTFKGRSRNYHKIIYNENFKFIYGLQFPFIYNKTKPSIGNLLINENDFKDYGLTQPDELKDYNKKLL